MRCNLKSWNSGYQYMVLYWGFTRNAQGPGGGGGIKMKNTSPPLSLRGGSRIFSQGGSGWQCHRDATGVSVEVTEGGLGGLPQENVEYEVL